MGWRISESKRFDSSSSVIPSKRFGFAAGLEAFRLLFVTVGVWGEEGIDVDGEGEGFFDIIVDIDGNGDDDVGGGDGETTFIIGDIIVFIDEDKGVVWVFVCSDNFCSLSTVDIVSRLSDSRNFDRNTSATSSEPNVLFKELNQKQTCVYK